MSTPNPANSPAQAKPDRKRIPMSVPSRKLEVAEIPGWHLYWFLESNVPQAINGGYEFVQANEVVLNQLNVATDRSISGNASLGGQVMVAAGAGGVQAVEHLVLMKIKKEWYDADRKAIEDTNRKVLEAIFKGEVAEGAKTNVADQGKTYLKERPLKPLFQRPARK